MESKPGKERARVAARRAFIAVHAALLTILAAVRVYLDISAPGFPAFSDTETYELLALQLYYGDALTLPVRPLGYPLFLALIYKVFGPSRDYVLYTQQALGVFSYFLYYLISLLFQPPDSARVIQTAGIC